MGYRYIRKQTDSLCYDMTHTGRGLWFVSSLSCQPRPTQKKYILNAMMMAIDVPDKKNQA